MLTIKKVIVYSNENKIDKTPIKNGNEISGYNFDDLGEEIEKECQEEEKKFVLVIAQAGDEASEKLTEYAKLLPDKSNSNNRDAVINYGEEIYFYIEEDGCVVIGRKITDDFCNEMIDATERGIKHYMYSEQMLDEVLELSSTYIAKKVPWMHPKIHNKIRTINKEVNSYVYKNYLKNCESQSWIIKKYYEDLCKTIGVTKQFEGLMHCTEKLFESMQSVNSERTNWVINFFSIIAGILAVIQLNQETRFIEVFIGGISTWVNVLIP